ncbi:hypothetical protein [Candidatus Amarolinea dominans]|uniref:hypothetical protein n=1 Tax=Candidatus Amarolinea dominans TaxID=3140696 RepID=UPI001D6D806B|nr:hypothetical protein [Anaerolineae bacterium]
MHRVAAERTPVAQGLVAAGRQIESSSGVHFDPGLRLLAAGREMKDTGRIVMQAGDEIVEGQAAFMHRGEQQGQHGLQAGHAGRRLGAGLFSRGVRRVIGGKTVNDIQVRPERGPVGGRGQGWLHLTPGTQAGQVILAQPQMVWRDLTGDRRAMLLGPANQLDLAAPADMADVQVLAVELCQRQAGCQQQPFGMHGDGAGAGPGAKKAINWARSSRRREPNVSLT